MKVDTRIIINAPIERAWIVLTDFDAYPDWNPVIRKLTISQQVGSTGKLVSASPSGLPVALPIKLEVFNETDYDIMWSGNTPKLLNFVLTGKHRLKLTAIDAHSCELENSEVFGGLLSHALGKLHAKITELYGQSNVAFKNKVELLN